MITSTLSQSELCFSDALAHIPGGVNSPVRAFKAVGGNPIFIDHAKGAIITDVDANDYIDYVCGYGPILLGHAHPDIVSAVQQAAQNGLGFGAPTQNETMLCDTIASLMPAIDQVRLVNSGTEATMSAIRLARGATGKQKIIKCAGCYHGHSDQLLVSAGSGSLTLATPSSAGVTENAIADTLIASYNDLDAMTRYFEQYPKDIAAIIIEPIAGNMNLVPAKLEYLKHLRALCDQYQTILIFDEVMSGFRVAKGGASEVYGIQPDLVCLGKIIGAGLPIGAFGGKVAIMQHLAPEGNVYQAGTCSGNPLAVAAGIAQLSALQADGFYEALSQSAQQLVTGLQQRADAAKIPFRAHSIGGMFGFAFYDKERRWESLSDVEQMNIERFVEFFNHMLQAGVYFAPSAFEAAFITSAHNQSQIQTTLDYAEKAFLSLNI